MSEAEDQFTQSVANYCVLRNALTKKTDLLRELRGNAENCFINAKTDNDNLSTLSDIIGDIQVSLDDASFGLEKYQKSVLESIESLNKMKILQIETKSNKNEDQMELDFNQRKTLETFERRYHKTIEKFEHIKQLYFTALSKQPAKSLHSSNSGSVEIDAKEQKMISNTSKNISNMIVRISSRVTFLQKQICQLKTFDATKNNAQKRRQNLNKIMELEKVRELNDQCATPINRLLLISQETRAEARALWSMMGLDTNVENNLKTQLNLYNFFTKKIQGPIHKKITPEMLLPDFMPSNFLPKKTSKDDEILSKMVAQNLASAQKPRLVSVATQSPNFTENAQQRQLLTQQKEVLTVLSNNSSFNSFSTPPTKPTLATAAPFLETPKASILQSKLENKFLFPSSKSASLFERAATQNVANNATNTSSEEVSPTSKPASTSFKQADVLVALEPAELLPKSQSLTQKSQIIVPKQPLVVEDKLSGLFQNKPNEEAAPLKAEIALSEKSINSTESLTPLSSATNFLVTSTPVFTTLTQSTVPAANAPVTNVNAVITTQPIQKTQSSSTTTVSFSFQPSLQSFTTPTAPATVPVSVNASAPNFAVTRPLASFSSGFPAASTAAPNVNFLFKPPTVKQPESTFLQSTAALNDVGMDEEMVGASLTNNASATQGAEAVNFNFNKTGLGSPFNTAPAANAVSKNPFGGSFSNNTTQHSQGWLFSNNANSAAAKPKTSSLFASTTASPQNSSAFGGSSAFGSGGNAFASQSGSTFVSGTTTSLGQSTFGSTAAFSSPIASSGNSAFGGGAVFCGISSFQGRTDAGVKVGSAFGGGAGSAFVLPNATQPAAATSSTGFWGYANKSSGFGQLAKGNSPKPQQQQQSLLFGSGGGGSAFSSFGGNAALSPAQSSPLFAGKSPAFTTFRK